MLRGGRGPASWWADVSEELYHMIPERSGAMEGECFFPVEEKRVVIDKYAAMQINKSGR